MAMPHFAVLQPASLDEALDLLAQHRTSVRILSGGTDLMLRMRAGALSPRHLVSLNRVPGLNHISFQEDDGLVIGAGARLSQVAAHPAVKEHYPALAQACSVMATVQIRNMGTVAGNLANAAPSADTAAPLLVYKASAVLVERDGRRQVELSKFFTGPGQTVIEPMEMIEGIRVPAPPARTGSFYLRISARSKVDIGAAGVAGFLSLDLNGRILAARLALSAVAPTPVRCPEAEKMLAGQAPEPALLKRAAAACVRAARPIDDVRSSASYRRLLVQILAERVLMECLRQVQGGEK